ncbi:MAG TPA: M13 family metallopeptidase, partial [Blastocatellia bacterium]
MRKGRANNSMRRCKLPALLLLFSLTMLNDPATLPLSGDTSQSSRSNAGVHGFNTANLDRSAKPCDDFYKFAAGGWMDANPIPPAYPSWGNFSRLSEVNDERLRAIMEEAAKNTKAEEGSNEQKIGDFYYSGMDEKGIEMQGAKPLDSEFKLIERISDLRSLQAEVAHLQHTGVWVLFYFTSELDPKDSSRTIIYAGQGGLGLIDRDYYLNNDDKSKQIRDDYLKHIGRMLELLGDQTTKASTFARAIMRIETELAGASMTLLQQRDPQAVYHKMNLAQLKQLTPRFSWEEYFKDLGHPTISEVDIGQPEFFKKVDDLIATTTLADWKAYLRWHLIRKTAPLLSSKIVKEDFDFNGKLFGTTEMLPRWKRVVSAAADALADALGQEYVKRYFPREAKQYAEGMINQILSVLRENLFRLPWMGEPSRRQAIAKLDSLTKKIGYPVKWIDYSKLPINRESYVSNVLRAKQFLIDRELNKIGRPPDKAEWQLSAYTVNAYYDAQKNEIVFPAGILQPPFFDLEADDAINYGAIGALIGHEITHAFDDQGAKFDHQGNLFNWWQPGDFKNFK